MNSSLFVYVHLLELVARAVVFMNKRVHELFIYVHLETDSAKRRTLKKIVRRRIAACRVADTHHSLLFKQMR